MQRYDESWIWRRADRRHVTESTRNFAALDECVADAVCHGYVVSAENAKGRPPRRLAQTTKRPATRESQGGQKS